MNGGGGSHAAGVAKKKGLKVAPAIALQKSLGVDTVDAPPSPALIWNGEEWMRWEQRYYLLLGRR